MSQEKKAIILANITAILLIAIKSVAGIMTGSMAVFSSALDSLLDFIVSSVNLYILKRSQSPTDEHYNYGHGKIEGIGAIIEGLIIGVSGGMIIYFAIMKLINKGSVTSIEGSIIVMIISIILTGMLVRYLKKTYNTTESLIIKSDMLHYESDLITNIGIIISLIIIKFTGYEQIDSFISIIIAIYIIHGAIKIIKEGFEMIMDKSLEKEIVEKIIDIIINTDKLVTSYHFLKTRKSGKHIYVEVHLVFNPDIKLIKAHSISDKIELKIKQLLKNAITTIHLDPIDDSTHKELHLL